MTEENCLKLYEIANKYDAKFVLNTENGRYVNKNEIDEEDDLIDTMAFGDDYNDVPMFETVGHAVVMENANDYIKKNYADEIAESNNLDGVAKVLEKLL